MKTILIAISCIGLLLTVVPSILVFYGYLSWEAHTHLMIAGFLCYFLSAPFWMKSKATSLE